MISTLHGNVIESGNDSIVLAVSGVGFEVKTSSRTLLQHSIGSEITVHTRMVVREDEMSMYGFSSKEERQQFDLLCSVSGVGPKLAMTVLSSMGPESFARAISEQDEAALRAIAGVGPKTAKLILLNLSGKMAQSVAPSASRVLAALVQLGTDEAVARKLLSELDPTMGESEMLKEALRILGKKK